MPKIALKNKTKKITFIFAKKSKITFIIAWQKKTFNFARKNKSQSNKIKNNYGPWFKDMQKPQILAEDFGLKIVRGKIRIISNFSKIWVKFNTTFFTI